MKPLDWRQRFPRSQGWKQKRKPKLTRGTRVPDFVAYRGNERVVGDAKDKASLTHADVDAPP